MLCFRRTLCRSRNRAKSTKCYWCYSNSCERRLAATPLGTTLETLQAVGKTQKVPSSLGYSVQLVASASDRDCNHLTVSDNKWNQRSSKNNRDNSCNKAMDPQTALHQPMFLQ